MPNQSGKQRDTNIAKRFQIRSQKTKNKDNSIPTQSRVEKIGIQEYYFFEDAMQRKDYDRAIIFAKKCLDKRPDWDGGWVNIGLCHLKKGEWDKALEAFNVAEEKGITLSELFLNRAHVYSVLENFPAAERDLLLLLQRYPNDPDARANLASLYFEMGKYPEALKAYQDHLYLFTEDQEALLAYFGMCELTGRVEEIARVFPSVMEFNEKNIAIARSYCNRLALKMSTNRVDPLLHALRPYAAKNPNRGEEVLILIELALNAANRGEFKDAENSLREAETIAETELCTKELGNVFVGRGSIYLMLGNLNQAADEFHKAISQAKKAGNPVLAIMVTNNLGCIMRQAGENAEAEELFLKLVSNCEKLHDTEGLLFAYNNLAGIYVTLERWDDAKKYGTLALSLAKSRDDNQNEILALGVLARVDAQNLDLKGAQSRLDYAESLVEMNQNVLDRFKFLFNRWGYYFTNKNFPRAHLDLQEMNNILGQWMEENSRPNNTELKEFQQAIISQLGTIEKIINDPDVPEEDKSEFAYLIKRACEIFQKNPKKIEDPKIASQLPQFLKREFSEKILLKRQVADLNTKQEQLLVQINELRNRPRNEVERTGSEHYWQSFLGIEIWNWLSDTNKEELLFAYRCRIESKQDSRFFRVCMRSLALVVEDQFNTRFLPLARPWSNLLLDNKSVPRKGARTIEELVRALAPEKSVTLGTIPFIFSAIANPSNSLYNHPFFQKINSQWQGNLSTIQQIIKLFVETIGNDPDAKNFSKYRNLDAHQTKFSCTESLLTLFESRVRELLVKFKQLFP